MKERSLETVHLNGDYLPLGEAFVSVEDRGFLLGDGLYEVTPVYRGAPFRLERHLDRMRFGLRELRIDYDAGQVEEVHHRLIRENELEGEALSLVYLQVTRGVAPRSHAFPKGPLAPTVFAYAKAFGGLRGRSGRGAAPRSRHPTGAGRGSISRRSPSCRTCSPPRRRWTRE